MALLRSIPLLLAVLTAIWILATLLLAPRGWLREPLTEDRQVASFVAAARAALPETFPGALVLLTIEGGKVSDGFTIGHSVDAGTAFQVASLSKWVAAAGVLALVDRGRIALDDPASLHLRRWQLPSHGADGDAVTVRHLLSHTGGLHDGLGYDGVRDPAAVQDIVSSLTAPNDAMPGASGVIAAETEPGPFAYSGGGFAVLQLLVEDVTGLPFAEAMDELVLGPLAMDESSFDEPRAPLAPFLDAEGGTAPHYRYAVPAAASLYASAEDMTRFLVGMSKPITEGGLISASLLAEMAGPEARVWGQPVWGLGVTLYVVEDDVGTLIGHDGRNRPALNTAARLHTPSGDGIVVLASGTPDQASRLADAWVYWRTGRIAVTRLGAQWPGAVVLAISFVAFGTLSASILRHRRRR